MEKAKEQVRQEEGHPRGHLPKVDASFAPASIGHPNAPRMPCRNAKRLGQIKEDA